MKIVLCFAVLALIVAFPLAYADPDCDLKPAYVQSGTVPSLYQYLHIVSFDMSVNTSACNNTFLNQYSTCTASTCTQQSECAGPTIHAVSLEVNAIYRVDSVNGNCIELCKCSP